MQYPESISNRKRQIILCHTIACVVICASCSTPPRDGHLVSVFMSNRTMFEKILAIEKRHGFNAKLITSEGTICDIWQKIPDEDVLKTISDTVRTIGGIRSLYLKNINGEMYFDFYGEGAAFTSGYSKGIAYLPEPPKRIVAALDDLNIYQARKQVESVYMHIEGNWYVGIEFSY
jgi:hypothetical protein